MRRLIVFLVVVVVYLTLIPTALAQGPVPIDEIVTLETAIIVAGGLIISLVGATVAVTVRHLTSQNWNFHIQDVWYYIFSASISVALVVLGADTASILTATTGINTPIAVLKSSIDQYTARKERKDRAEIIALKERLERIENVNMT